MHKWLMTIHKVCMLYDTLESVGESKFDVISKLFIYSGEETKWIILDVRFIAMNAGISNNNFNLNKKL